MASSENGEVSEHDDSGALGDSRHDGRIKAERAAQAIAQQDFSGSGGHRPQREIGRSQSEIEPQIIDEASGDIEAIYRELHVTSGPLPGAEEYKQYPPEVQAHILECHNAEVKAVFTDESARQDRLVDAEVKRDKLMLVLSFIIEAILAVGPIVGFAITGYKEMLWAYTVLGASLIGNVVININSKKHRDDHEDIKKD